MKVKNAEMLQILRAELAPAVGCTEPAAVALTCAKGKKYLDSDLKQMVVNVSRNIYKNGLMVGIPGTSQKGLLIAAALGYVCGNAEAELEVLKDVSAECTEKAEKLIASSAVSIKLDESRNGIYIRTVMEDHDGNTVEIVLEGRHTYISALKKNEEVLLNNPYLDEDKTGGESGSCMSIQSIFQFSRECAVEDIAFLKEYANMNVEAAKHGMTKNYGLSIGRLMYQGDSGRQTSVLDHQTILEASSLTASASDARMAGCNSPIMTNSGSGNQGITAAVPVCFISDRMKTDPEMTIRALCLSNLIAIYLKQRSDRLSAFCGTVTAAIGAACGVGFLFGAELQCIEDIINTAFSGISGMICDGAKSSCALKILLAVENALLSAKLVLENHHVPHGEGIVCKSAEETIDNIHTLTMQGMRSTDDTIISIMK